jgi:ubiquinone biosynthesis protein
MFIAPLKSAVDTWSQVPRYREIFGVFYKYGFSDFIQFAHLQALSDILARTLTDEEKELQEKPMAVRFRMALEELGPTFVKMGQILSSRRDLLDEVFYNELRKLQAHVTPIPGEVAWEVLAAELAVDPSRIYKTFKMKPLAAASIGQVHRATLQDDTEVVVKIQRPDIRDNIEKDLAIMAEIARLLDKYVDSLAVLNPVAVVRDFSKTLLKELDYLNEAKNMRQMREEFAEDGSIRIPEWYEEFSTSKVLTMEYLKGRPIDRPVTLINHGIDPLKLSEDISRLIYKQVLDHGFFHADPHPGNMAVQDDGAIILYDFGMMGKLTPSFREDIADLVMSLTDRDARTLMFAVIGMSEESFVDNPIQFEEDLEMFSENHLNKPLKDIKVSHVLNRLLDLLMKYKLRMKSNFYLGVKALSQVEDIGMALNPDLNFIELGKPYARKMFTDKMSLERIQKSLSKLAVEGLRFAENVPGDFKELYSRIRSGNISIPIEHKVNPEGFEPMRSTLDQIANRLAEAILTAAVLICSSILILSGIPPAIYGIPAFGLIGMLLGLVMALRLTVAIWRRSGLDGSGEKKPRASSGRR